MKTKNMKLRSSQMREINNDQGGLEPVLMLTMNIRPKCSYVDCEKGPDLKVMTDQFPIDSATFTKINDYLYKIQYNFNSKLNDSFRIVGPFPSSIISEIDNYELRKQIAGGCECNRFFSLRNKLLFGEKEGFTNLENILNASNGGVIGIRSQIILPTSFIVFNQQGLYYYLNVDQNSNVTFTPT